MATRRSDRLRAKQQDPSDESERVQDVDEGGKHSDSEKEEKPVGSSVEPRRSGILHFVQYTMFPLWLMLFTPNFVMFLYHLSYRYGGAFHGKFFGDVHGKGPRHIINFLWPGRFYGSPFSVAVVSGLVGWAALWTAVLPGRVRSGPVTPRGHVPRYRENGFTYFILTSAAFLALQAALTHHGYTATVVIDRFDEILRTLNCFALLFCVLLYIKGRFSPNCKDSVVSRNFIFDYYWGIELYPRISGLDVKLLTNCRLGLMGWALLVMLHFLKSYELHGGVMNGIAISALLQLLYIAKFFYWEMGYMRTIDIMLDHAGYMLCWGCLVWIPGFYLVPTLYMINNPVHLPPLLAVMVTAAGIASLVVNYWADYQKQVARETNGNCHIWGSKPGVIKAKYTLEDGSEKESILLASGFWGLSRHFHYVPEISLAFFWCLPAGFSSVLPYFYVIFLEILLTHRSYRDDRKCSAKYGKYWQSYQKMVPYRIIPGLF